MTPKRLLEELFAVSGKSKRVVLHGCLRTGDFEHRFTEEQRLPSIADAIVFLWDHRAESTEHLDQWIAHDHDPDEGDLTLSFHLHDFSLNELGLIRLGLT